MKKETYNTLREQVKREGLLKQNTALSLAVIVMELGLFIALFSLLIQVEFLSLAYFGLVAILGISMFRNFALLHDAGHRALFRSERANDLAGYLLSPLCMLPYTEWRTLHLLHHKWVGVIDKDPTQKGLLSLPEYKTLKRGAFRLVWWLCLPIPSIQMITKVFWFEPFRNYARGEKYKAAQGIVSMFICLLPHILFVLWLGMAPYLMFAVPVIIMFFFWFEFINFTHHSGIFPYTSETHPNPIPLHEQDAVSRTSAFSKWVSIALAYNFNFHTEHHYFPRVPWHNLPRVYELVKETNCLADYNDVPFLAFSAKLRTSDPIKIYIRSIEQLGVKPHET